MPSSSNVVKKHPGISLIVISLMVGLLLAYLWWRNKKNTLPSPEPLLAPGPDIPISKHKVIPGTVPHPVYGNASPSLPLPMTPSGA